VAEARSLPVWVEETTDAPLETLPEETGRVDAVVATDVSNDEASAVLDTPTEDEAPSQTAVGTTSKVCNTQLGIVDSRENRE